MHDSVYGLDFYFCYKSMCENSLLDYSTCNQSICFLFVVIFIPKPMHNFALWFPHPPTPLLPQVSLISKRWLSGVRRVSMCFIEWWQNWLVWHWTLSSTHLVSQSVQYIQHLVSHSVQYIQHLVSQSVQYIQNLVSYSVQYIQHLVSHLVQYIQHPRRRPPRTNWIVVMWCPEIWL